MENWELIGKKLSGELNADESLRFEEWLASDDSHKLIWKDAEKIWLATGKSDFSFDVDTEKALIKFKTSRVESKPIALKKFFTPLKIAASVLFLAIPTFLIIHFTGEKKTVIAIKDKPQTPVPVFVKIKTITVNAFDSAISFYLPDSSHIYLNKNSTLVYPEDFSGTTRTVNLSGEAFFEIVRNKQKPFIVETANTETRVTGTSFNIREDTRTKKVEISVVTGEVKFRVKKNSEHLSEVTLVPNDRVIYSENNATMIRQKVKSPEDYWWERNFKGIRKLFQHAKKELSRPNRKK